MGKEMNSKNPLWIVIPIIGLALIVFGAVLYFWQDGTKVSWFGLSTGTMVQRPPHVDFRDWRLPSLKEGEVLFGRRELRMDEKARREVMNWDYSDEYGQRCEKRIMQLYDYIETHRSKSFHTSINPFLVCHLGGKPMMTKKQFFDHGLPKVSVFAQRIGTPMPENPYALARVHHRWLKNSGLREVATEDGRIAYERDGERISFRNIKIVCHYQRKPNTKNKDERAKWGDKDFSAKYIKNVNVIGDASLMSEYGTKAISVPGDISFDPGINDDNVLRPVKAARSANPDCSMEVFIELRGNFVLNGKEYEFGKDTPPVVARDYLFVKDYVPPLPEKGSVRKVEAKDDQFDFVIPQGRPHIGDQTGLGKVTAMDPDNVPIPLNYWPNRDKADRDGDGLDDYKWENIPLKGNDVDGALYKVMNYEVGIGLTNRIKYKSSSKQSWRYMYYLPYRPVGNELKGPYAGRVRSTAAGRDGYDKYDVDNMGQENYSKYYQPIVFPEKIAYCGRTYRPRALMDEIFRMADPSIEVAQKRAQLAAVTGFRHIAGISVMWRREVVSHIQLGNLRDPECHVSPGALLIPSGFSSCASSLRGRRPNFEAELPEPYSKDSPPSLLGSLSRGKEAKDCFYRVIARDGANNAAVLASSHYAAEDNLRPIPKITVRDGAKVVATMTIPNNLTAAGLPLGPYDESNPNTRIHSASVPLFTGERTAGVQGSDFRGYGNYSNNSGFWNCFSPLGTMHNPKDAQERSFLIGKGSHDLLSKELTFVIEAEDNISPTMDGAKRLWPINRLSCQVYGSHDSKYFPRGLSLATSAEDSERRKIAEQLAACNLKPKKSLSIIEDSDFTKEPKGTMILRLDKVGIYLFIVDVEDLSSNKRTMLALFQLQ